MDIDVLLIFYIIYLKNVELSNLSVNLLLFLAGSLKTPPMVDSNYRKLKTVQSKQKYPSSLASITPKPFSTVDSTLVGKIDQDFIHNTVNIFHLYSFLGLDNVKRILNVVLKIRYDLETLAQKQHHMDETISEMVLKLQCSETSNNEHIVTMSNQEDCDNLLPISNEETLIEFDF